MSGPKPWSLNLPSISLSLRVLFSGFLMVISLGLAMAGLQILMTHGMADGKFGLSVDDVVYSYYGDRGGSRLEAKLNGTMQDKATVAERAAIVKWVQAGSPKDDWPGEIQTIFLTKCIACHGTIPGFADFSTYDGVKPFAEVDEGKDTPTLARVSHIHLFGISFISFFVGLIFSLSVGLPTWLKATAIGTPFLFQVVDILSWWLTAWSPNFAFLTIIGGTAYNLAYAFMIITSLYQMWIMPLRGRTSIENTWARLPPVDP
jgi:hypothetical protein